MIKMDLIKSKLNLKSEYKYIELTSIVFKCFSYIIGAVTVIFGIIRFFQTFSFSSLIFTLLAAVIYFLIFMALSEILKLLLSINENLKKFAVK